VKPTIPPNIAWLLILIALLGCRARDTVEVTGDVSWEGAPLAQGDITFVDTDPHVPAAAGKIVDGVYAFDCKPGKKRVEIQSYRLSGRKTPQGNPIGEMYIPLRYSTESELTARVTLEGENDFDFALNP
jgi:hypothetical protein